MAPSMQLARLQPVEAFIVFGIIVFIVVLALAQKKLRRRRRQLLERLARQNGGQHVYLDIPRLFPAKQ